ncbi:MAG: hypothetical protein Q4E88_03325 [Coriobacteriia bacterium]|nr:hypothetical protein [Coriobacteriia bacterium]
MEKLPKSEKRPNDVFLFGKNVSKSLSPVIHNTIYKKLGLDLKYSALNFGSIKELKSFISTHKFVAANITYPYKQYFKNSNLIVGDEYFNFDGQGAYAFLKREKALASKVVIFGTGVTAHEISKFIPATLVGRKYKNPENLIADADLLIDATPVNTALKYQNCYNKKQIFMDLKYFDNYDYSDIFDCAYDGRGMLVSQAILCIQQICKKRLDFDVLFDIAWRRINEI